MAGTATDFRIEIESLLSQVNEIAGVCMIEHKEEIIPLLINQQLEQHTDSAGQPLREYRPNTKIHKQLEGKSGLTDFDETGEFHGEMNLSVESPSYFFNSPALTDKGELKSDWLREWNGSEVMELTSENEALIWPMIVDDFNTKMSEAIGLD